VGQNQVKSLIGFNGAAVRIIVRNELFEYCAVHAVLCFDKAINGFGFTDLLICIKEAFETLRNALRRAIQGCKSKKG
jgi:hypothetical protein